MEIIPNCNTKLFGNVVRYVLRSFFLKSFCNEVI
jgi:hypothetical protein